MSAGGLYNGYAVVDSRGLCPAGFHVSTEAAWIDMELALGIPKNELNAIVTDETIYFMHVFVHCRIRE